MSGRCHFIGVGLLPYVFKESVYPGSGEPALSGDQGEGFDQASQGEEAAGTEERVSYLQMPWLRAESAHSQGKGKGGGALSKVRAHVCEEELAYVYGNFGSLSGCDKSGGFWYVWD